MNEEKLAMLCDLVKDTVLEAFRCVRSFETLVYRFVEEFEA